MLVGMSSAQELGSGHLLNMSQQQIVSAAEQQQSFYELMMKEKLEAAQLKGQLCEVQRQLDKSRKDYAKLLSQVDED